MIPSHPFELTIFYKDGKVQRREFERLDTAVGACRTLSRKIVRGYALAVVLETQTLSDGD